jgi:hypothetical protein
MKWRLCITNMLFPWDSINITLYTNLSVVLSYDYTDLEKYRNTYKLPQFLSNIWFRFHRSFLLIWEISIYFWNAVPHVPSCPQFRGFCRQHTHAEERWVLWQWPLGQIHSTLLGKDLVQQLLTRHMQQNINRTRVIFMRCDKSISIFVG